MVVSGKLIKAKYSAEYAEERHVDYAFKDKKKTEK